jgi:uncharacterized membrane protein YidH (DUF202 family)
MLSLLRAWGGALFVLIVGAIAMVRLTPRVTPGESIPVSDQAFRIHLPWLVISVLMVAVAGALHWQPSTMRRRLLATLPVPALAVLAGAAVGVSGATSPLVALVYLGEGVLGVALGLLITSLFARDERPATYHYSG